MREHHLAFPSADPELDIASPRVNVPGPEPAAVGLLIHAREEPFIVIAVDALADERVIIAVPALVVSVAPAAARNLACAAVYCTLACHIESLLGKAGTVTREEAHKALDGVAAAMRDQHADQEGRLHQLTSHLATAGMAVDLLFDHAENTAAEGGA